MRQRTRACARAYRLRTGRSARLNPLGDTLQDGCDAKQVVRHVEAPVLRQHLGCRQLRAVAVLLDVLRLGWDAQAGNVHAANATAQAFGDVPCHAVVAEVGQRVAQGGEFPIQHGDYAGFGRVKHQVIKPEVAVHDARHSLVTRHGGNVLRQPRHQLVHLGNRLRDRGHVLLAPPADLALKIVARFAVATQTLIGKLHGVQRGNDAVHLAVDLAALDIAHARQGLIPHDPALHEFHDVEGAADDGLVFTQAVHLRHRHVGSRQPLHHRKFALDRVRGGQQLGHRAGLGAHHVAFARRDELVSRVGLAAFEGLDRQRAFEAIQVFIQPRRQGIDIECVFFRNSAGAYKMFVISHKVFEVFSGCQIQQYASRLAGCAPPGHRVRCGWLPRAPLP